MDKYWGTPSNFKTATPYETIFGHGNTLADGGADVLWHRACTLNPTTLANGASILQAFSSGNAAIGVGDSTVAATSTQADLLAPTGTTARRIRGMSTASYPSRTSGVTTAARTVQFQSIFTTTEAAFSWDEWSVWNDPCSSDASGTWDTGRMLNRKQQALGSKTTLATWTFSVSLTLS